MVKLAGRSASIDSSWYGPWSVGVIQDEDVVQQIVETCLQQYRRQLMDEGMISGGGRESEAG